MARALSSSYSRFDTHIFLKVSSEARIEPLSGEETVRTTDSSTATLQHTILPLGVVVIASHTCQKPNF